MPLRQRVISFFTIVAFMSFLSSGSESVRAQAIPVAAPTPHASPPATQLPPRCTTNHCRADHSIVMDVDYTHYANNRTGDVIALTSDIETQIDLIVARQGLRTTDGLPVSVSWTEVDGGTRECRHPTDAGILEIMDAELLSSRHQYVFIGQQREEARLKFRLLGCAGDERLRYPEHGTASIVVRPSYVSIYGTVGLVSLLRSGGSNNGNAAALAAVAANSSLEPDLGSHSDQSLRSMARHRLVYGRKSARDAQRKPPPHTLSALFATCGFMGYPSQIVCDKQAPSAGNGVEFDDEL